MRTLSQILGFYCATTSIVNGFRLAKLNGDRANAWSLDRHEHRTVYTITGYVLGGVAGPVEIPIMMFNKVFETEDKKE